jgi:RND superfamily putative drug exporter
VFASFVLGEDPNIKIFGLGLAVAVFIDATVVRIVLVPATMELLGDRNWWIPGWLDRILPRLHVEGGRHRPVQIETTPRPIPEPVGR